MPKKKKPSKQAASVQNVATNHEVEIDWTVYHATPKLDSCDPCVLSDEMITFIDLLFTSPNTSHFEMAVVHEAMKLATTIIRKNRDYGSSINTPPPLTPHLDAGIAMDVRLSDKLMRLIQLSKRPPEVVHESIEDTKMDIVGYILLQRAFERTRE